MPNSELAKRGKVFRCWQKNANGSQVADDASQTWAIDLTSIAAGKHICIDYDFFSGGDAEIQLWENVTYADGSAFTPLNKHRASQNSPTTGLVIKSGATITTTSGTQLVGRWIPGGSGPQSTGGNASSIATWTLDAGKKYALIGINRNGSAQDMSLGFHFWEES